MSWPKLSATPHVWHGVQSLALALLMASITVGAVKVFGWKWRPARPHAAAAGAGSARGFNLAHDQVLVPVRPELESDERAAAQPAPLHADAKRSASELFAAAELARTRGELPEALRLSKQIEEFFPNSEQGIKTHLTLGVLYLALGKAELALQEFATFRRIGSPEAKAEAYFGQAQALRKLARTEDERSALAELLQSYPRSVYVAAARARLNEIASEQAAP